MNIRALIDKELNEEQKEAIAKSFKKLTESISQKCGLRGFWVIILRLHLTKISISIFSSFRLEIVYLLNN